MTKKEFIDKLNDMHCTNYEYYLKLLENNFTALADYCEVENVLLEKIIVMAEQLGETYEI